MCVYYIGVSIILTHTQNRILLSHKKNEIVPYEAIWMGLETITLSEVSQKWKGK